MPTPPHPTKHCCPPAGALAMAAYQYVYVMKDVTKAFPGGREVFKGDARHRG